MVSNQLWIYLFLTVNSNGGEPPSADYLEQGETGEWIRTNSGWYREVLGADVSCSPKECCAPEPCAFAQRVTTRMLPLMKCIPKKRPRSCQPPEWSGCLSRRTRFQGDQSSAGATPQQLRSAGTKKPPEVETTFENPTLPGRYARAERLSTKIGNLLAILPSAACGKSGDGSPFVKINFFSRPARADSITKADQEAEEIG